MEKSEKKQSFFQNAKKIVNLRFPELNQLGGEKFFSREKISKGFSSLGKHPAWKVMVLGLAVIGGVSMAQYLIPADQHQLVVIPKEVEEEVKPSLLNEPETLPVGSPSSPKTETIGEDKPNKKAESTQTEGAKPSPAEDLAAVTVSATTPDWNKIVKPVSGQIGADFGFAYAEFFEDYRLHRGIDIIAPKGSPVVAALPGVVSTIHEDVFYGKTITIRHGDQWESLYAQLEDIIVEEGQEVAAGEKLASIGSPALAEANGGTHLHFELIFQGEPVDPKEYLK